MNTQKYRLVYFVQSHNKDESNEHLSMLPLGVPSRHTTHVVLAAFHLNYTKDNGAGNHKVYMNDEIYDEGDNVIVWEEAEKLRSGGISIFAQIGADAWEANHLGGSDEVFEKGYQLFAAMIRDKKVDGVDCNVEPHDDAGIQGIDNDRFIRIVKRLRADFPNLVITLCPGGGELEEAGYLSALRYKSLHKAIGHEIAWYNVQLYNGWGRLTVDDFDGYVGAGFEAEKLAMLLPGQASGISDGWCSGPEIKQGLHDIIAKYPIMGGVGCWDWNGATVTGKKPVEHPEEWCDFVSSCLYPKSN